MGLCPLQPCYVCSVYFGINAWFCAYCTHATRIDTPSQKMHVNEVSEVDMGLVVEKVRAHQ